MPIIKNLPLKAALFCIYNKMSMCDMLGIACNGEQQEVITKNENKISFTSVFKHLETS